MERLIFDSSGKLIGVDGKNIEKPKEKEKKLKTSDTLSFLKPEKEANLEEIKEAMRNPYWNLYSEGKSILPLKFSNGKTQEDIIKEIVDLIKAGNKIIFLHGACGTGKSAVALNIARILGRASIIVPVKTLQKQYEDDYTQKKYLIKSDGKRMKIAMITGRDNHDSIIWPSVPCSDPFLPENIKIAEKNYPKLLSYYRENPLINSKSEPELKDIRRLSIAPTNPYWSPILPADFERTNLKDARKIKYKGVGGREYIFYHRKPGCSYYDQYLAYMDADVIIFNSAKYRAELAIGRKPQTDVEIIDEADNFLDSLFEQDEINLTKLASSIRAISVDNIESKETIFQITDIISTEEKNKKFSGIDENKVFHIKETKIKDILELLRKDEELEAAISIDELNYSNRALEASRTFPSLDDVYLTYRIFEGNLLVKLVSTNLSGKVKELIDSNKALVFMSGTLHSENVIRNIFGIKDYKIVEAEALNQGNIEIIKTGKEFDCKYSNFSSNKHSREDYLNSLSLAIQKAPTPFLVHVNAFQDLPSEIEKERFSITNILSSEKLREMQKQDKVGENISKFKKKLASSLFTTKCSRGVDFPGDICRAIIFTKYPNPNISETFWKILQKTHPEYFWEFYKDKASREFLQRIYRAVRSKDDHVYILSPDSRVLETVRELQLKSLSRSSNS
ncbi:DEAD/DEAH box helicase family protein [Candidatus Pacearchaeota archaeon]|nr:DEAD/DEAH box helicase family protein [Candidatus Pacearchaeota archaeon]